MTSERRRLPRRRVRRACSTPTDAPSGPSAPASTTRWPGSTRPSPTGSTRGAGGVLPDARRRRAGLLAPALGVVHATPRTWRRTSRWPTSRSTCSARPGCCSPGRRRPTRVVPALPAGSPVPPEDALAFFRGRRRVPQRAARRARRRRLRARPSCGCCCSRPGGSRCCSGWRPRATRCSPRSPAKGVKEVTYHRDYAARWFVTLGDGTDESRSRLLAGDRARVPDVDELFTRHPGRGRGRRGGRRCGSRRPWPTRSRRVLAAGVRRRDVHRARAARWARSRRRWAATGGTPRRWRTCSPRCSASPAHTRWGGGDRRRRSARAVERERRPAGVAATVTDPEMPMLTLDDLGVLRSVTSDEDDAVVVHDHPDLLRLPGDGDDARRPGAPARQRRLHGARCASASTPRGPATGSPRAAAGRWPAHGISAPLAAPAPARAGARSRCCPTRRALTCPRCGSADVELTSEFGPTACKALYRCASCLEPFEHVKEI